MDPNLLGVKQNISETTGKLNGYSYTMDYLPQSVLVFTIIINQGTFVDSNLIVLAGRMLMS